MASPTVPPRPTRASVASPTSVKDDQPRVPPRPFRKLEPSPTPDDYIRSPLNEMPNSANKSSRPVSGSNSASAEATARPPMVQAIPSIGQEGLEYASYDQLPPEARGVPAEGDDTPKLMRNVSANMPLHAPTAGFSQSTAKSRIAAVTKTDSIQAAAAGIGKATPEDDVHRTPGEAADPFSRVVTAEDTAKRETDLHPLRLRDSFNGSSSSLQRSRPTSIYGESNHGQGIPEIGMQIPLYPNAGDVQAPSPAHTQSQHAPGVGFFNDGSTRAHHRKRSGKHQFAPPDSYGLHGHHTNLDSHDQFEKEWVSKHPEQAAKEGYKVYGNLNMPRPETALSTEELNRLVNPNGDQATNVDPSTISTPSQEMGFYAADEYAARMNSPKILPSVGSLAVRSKRPSSGAQPAVESPLRKATFAASEDQDDDVIHIDDLRSPHDPSQATDENGGPDAGPRGANMEEQSGWHEDRDGAPILASDETLKRSSSAFMQPAVNLEYASREEDHSESDQGRDSQRNSTVRPLSRPTSRPGSRSGEYHGGSLHRFISHDEHHASGHGTPLEEIEEYEPLFPEGEQEKPKPKALRRPRLEAHQYPSQDVWEDTPSSLQFQTTVETPEPPMAARAPPPEQPKASSAFETGEQEPKRKDNSTHDMMSDGKTILKPVFKSGVVEDMHRPGLQRFPSRDIWEDTPDSMRLVTTVNSAQTEATKSPVDDGPTTSLVSGDTRATTGFTSDVKPSVPSRPQRRSHLAKEMKPAPQGNEEDAAGADRDPKRSDSASSSDKARAPSIPSKLKPSVPARPAKTPRFAREGECAPLSKSSSADDDAIINDVAPSTAGGKAKPAVPPRPAGEKLAALKAGFMNDLNNRLKLGPQAATSHKDPELDSTQDSEKAPLVDARKGRARGPARRKPAVSPPSSTEAAPALTPLSFSTPTMIWQIDEAQRLAVASSGSNSDPPSEEEGTLSALGKVLAENEAAQTAEPTPAQPGRSRAGTAEHSPAEGETAESETAGAAGASALSLGDDGEESSGVDGPLPSS